MRPVTSRTSVASGVTHRQLSMFVEELKELSHSAVLRASALLSIELCTLKLTASER